MESPYNRRSLTLAVVTGLGLFVTVVVMYAFVVQFVFFSGAVSFQDMPETHLWFRSALVLLTVILGVRIAAGRAVRRSIPGGLGAVVAGSALAAVGSATLLLGCLMIGRLWFENLAACTVIDLFVWAVGTALAVTWAVARTPVNPAGPGTSPSGAVYGPARGRG